MVKYQKVEIYCTTVVFLVEPTKVEFELMYHDNVERITDDEYKQMYQDTFQNNKCCGYTVGIDVCICANFVDSVWLYYYHTVGSVHGIGYPYEDMTSEQTLDFIEYEWKQYDTKVIECKDVQELINEIKKVKVQ